MCNSVLFPKLKIVGENLGTAAFALSLLALIINLTILCWLCWKTLVDTLTNTAATGKEHRRALY